MGQLGKPHLKADRHLPATAKPFKDVLALKFHVWYSDHVSDALTTNRNITDAKLSLKPLHTQAGGF